MQDPRLEQLERILASAGFAQSDRLSRFLRYVVEETVAGRESQIKETTIGVEVFGKPAGFDPKADSTVRSEAVKLRSRLAAYYAAAPGDGDPWIITIPKGTYVPEFTPPHRPAEIPVAEPAPTTRPMSGLRKAGVVGIGGIAALVGGYLIWNTIPPRSKVTPVGRQPVRLTWDRGVNTHPALSAEGKLLVYASTRSGEGNVDIWIRSVQSGSGIAEPLRLTSHPANDSDPDISPQGDLVVFRSERDGGGIYAVSALGGGERLLVPGGRRPRFSPGDGRRIAYYTGEPRLFQSAIASGRIFVADAAGSEPPRQLAPGFAAAVSPVWSPDGKSILFLGYAEQDFATHKMDWWLTAADGSGAPAKVGFNEAVEKHQTCGAKARAPYAWTSGDTVLFQTDCSGTSGIARIELRGGKIRGRAEPVTVGSGGESAPTATPSGLIAYVANSQRTSIWSAPLTASQEAPRRLTDSEAKEQYPSISEDGKLLAYVSLRSGNPDVWLRNLATGQERLLAGGPGHQTYSEIEADGRHVVYTTLEPDPKDPVGFNSIAWRKPVADGPPVKICEHCAYYGHFGGAAAAASHRIFDLDGRPTFLSVRDASKLEWPRFLGHPKFDVLKPAVHPSRKWVAFNVKHDDVARIHVAALDESSVQPIPVSAWVELADGYMPLWSRDGKTLYFASNRDGNDCIWALPFDPGKGKAAGAASPLVHFHSPEERLDPGVDVYRWMSVSRNHIVYPASRVASSIWILR